MKTKTYWVQPRDNETMPTDHSGGNEVRDDHREWEGASLGDI